MRKHADWMAHPDDRILELLRERGPLKGWEIRHQLAEVGADLTYPERYLQSRYSSLATHGLIEKRVDGTYQVTELGESYLDGDVDVGTIDVGDGDEGSSENDSKEFII